MDRPFHLMDTKEDGIVKRLIVFGGCFRRCVVARQFLLRTVLGAVLLPVVFLAPPGVSGETEPVEFVGTIVAVTAESRTLVVDVPLATDVLRIGAEVTDATKITHDGQTFSLDRLQAGDRVRLEFRRTATGNEAIAVEVLQGPRG